jgi:hypothetical protein
MKSRELLKKLQSLLNADQREQLERRDALKKLLKKLRKRRDALKKDLENAESRSERKRIRKELEILKVQRRKGVTLLRELKE